MKLKISLFFLSSIFLISCQNKAILLENINIDSNLEFYFISSEIMGPNTQKEKTDFQKQNASFYIDNKEAVKILKKEWQYESIKNFDNFVADYYLTYTENGKYRGKISIDLSNNIAVSGYGPTYFNKKSLNDIQKYIKPLKTQFFEFTDLSEARKFYNAIKNKNWILPSSNDIEYYKWTEFDGESIIKVNDKQFARDKDIKKAFKAYMPKRYPNDKFYYNIFRFTPQNSSIRICSNKDLSERFPKDFHVIVPWKKYDSIILPLINYDEKELKEIISGINIHQYKIIDKIE